MSTLNPRFVAHKLGEHLLQEPKDATIKFEGNAVFAPQKNIFHSSPEGEKTKVEPEYLIRPGAVDFLQRLSKNWEIVLYSSRKESNLGSLLDLLDPQRLIISSVLDRKSCSMTVTNRCVKDIENAVEDRPLS